MQGERSRLENSELGQFCPYGSLVRMFAGVRIADPNVPEANSAGVSWVIVTAAPGIRSAGLRVVAASGKSHRRDGRQRPRRHGFHPLIPCESR
jgi:hypothetical protein